MTIQVFNFDLELMSIYASKLDLEAIEIVIELYGSLSRFFNIFVSEALRACLMEFNMRYFIIGENKNTDDLVYGKIKEILDGKERFLRFENGEHLYFGYDHQDLTNTIILATTLILIAAVENTDLEITGYVEKNEWKLADINNISAISEYKEEREFPLSFVIEVELSCED